MIPLRGKKSGESKQWKKRYYCSHGFCNSNTKDGTDNVKMLPFPKPCDLFYKSILHDDNNHNIKSCAQCHKCTRWMKSCRRADAKFSSLVDISTKTYICSKHFFDSSGPTLEHPDPFPVGKLPITVKNERKPPAERQTPPTSMPTKKRCHETSGLPESTNTCEEAIPSSQTPTSMHTKKRCDETSGIQESTNTCEEAIPSSQTPPASMHTKNVYLLVTSDLLESTITYDEKAVRPSSQTPSTSMPTKKRCDETICIQEYTVTCEEAAPYKNDLEELAKMILYNSLPIHFLEDCILITPLKDVVFTVDRSFNVSLKVHDFVIDGQHEIWKVLPKSIGPNPRYMNYVTAFKLIQEQWHVCSSFLMACAASTFQETFKWESISDETLNIIKTADKCAVLSKHVMCLSCKPVIAKLNKKIVRRKKNQKDSLKTNIKYMSKEDAQKYVRKSRRSLRLEKRKTVRLRKQLSKVIGNQGVQLCPTDLLTESEEDINSEDNNSDKSGETSEGH